MRTLKAKLVAILASVMLLCFGAVAFVSLNNKTVQAATYDTNSFAIVNAGSVRTETPYGIRFKTIIGNDKLNSLDGEGDTFGTLIIPKDILDASGKALTLEFDYQGYTPINYAYNGDVQTLETGDKDGDYVNYKGFNAVLTDINENYYTKGLVARSYITVDGVTSYSDTVTRSIAYVAAKALDAGETGSALSQYVQAISGENGGNLSVWHINMKVGETKTYTANIQPKGVFPINYVIESGSSNITAVVKTDVETDNGVEFTAQQVGTGSFRAKVAGNTVTAGANISVLDDVAVFANEYYVPETSHTFTVYNCTDVIYNGETLVKDTDYTLENGVVTITKALLYEKSTGTINTLTFKSAKAGDVTINVEVGTGLTQFSEGQMTKIIGQERTNVKSVTLSDEYSYNNDGGKSIKIVFKQTTNWARFGFDPEFLHAIYANPNVETFRFRYYMTGFVVDDANNKVTYGYTWYNSDGTLKAYGTAKAQDTWHDENFDRAVYEAMCANNVIDTRNIGFNVNAGTLTNGEGTIYLDFIQLPNGHSNIIADYPAIENGGLTLGVVGEVEEFKVNDSDKLSLLTDKVDTITLPAVAFKDVVGVSDKQITVKTDMGMEALNYLSISPVVENYVVVDDESSSTYTYALTNNSNLVYPTAGNKILTAKLNGTTIIKDGVIANGVTGITLTDAGIVFEKTYFADKLGNNKLEMYVKKIASASSVDIDTYCVTIAAVKKANLANAVTFEDNSWKSFVTVIGAKSVEVVSTSVITGYADATSMYVPTANNEIVANNNILKIVMNAQTDQTGARVYVSTYYLQQRMKALKTLNNTLKDYEGDDIPTWSDTNDLRAVFLMDESYASGGLMSYTFKEGNAPTAAGYGLQCYTSESDARGLQWYKYSEYKGSCQRQFLSRAEYNKLFENDTIVSKYVYTRFRSAVDGSIAYLDNMGMLHNTGNPGGAWSRSTAMLYKV